MTQTSLAAKAMPQPANDFSKTTRLLSALEILRSQVDPDMSIATAAVFLMIAQRHEQQRGVENCPTNAEIARSLGIDTPKASRAVRVLAEGHDRAAKATGQGLIEQVLDPADSRLRRNRLSSKGLHLLNQLQLALA